MNSKVMSNTIFTFLLVVPVFVATAQEFPSELWHNGVLVILEGDTLKGQIKYDLQNDIVQMNIRNTIQTFSARKIHYFEIYDETIESHRHFYALPFAVQSTYKVPLIFEVLYEGQLSLLCREEVVTESVPQYNAYPYSYYGGAPFNNSRARLKYSYYFLERQGKEGIQSYNLKKNELYPFFKKNQQQVKQYIKKNNLKHDSMRDLVRIVAYYNALLDS